MSNLIVVGFKNNRFKATEVLNKLRQLNEDWTISLDDAVAVYRGYDGELRIDQSYELTTGEGAVWGGLWGSLLGAILAIPFTGGASAAAAVAAGALGGGAPKTLSETSVIWFNPEIRQSSRSSWPIRNRSSDSSKATAARC
jgi:uncharacterized membrane protein